MAGYTLANLQTDIRNYTEVDSNVFTAAVLNRFIENAEHRINLDCPMDSDREEYFGSVATDVNTVRVPAGFLFVRGVQVFNSTTSRTGQPFWLERRDQTFISEFVGKLTGTAGGAAGADVTGLPKYYAMFGGATGLSDTTSGGMYIAPTPDANYKFRVYYNKIPVLLEGSNTNYISLNFPQGLLYCCLAETYAFLKGPMDMLTLYEQKYKNAIQQFAGMQLGRRRRDDYTDGTVRIQVKSPSP